MDISIENRSVKWSGMLLNFVTVCSVFFLSTLWVEVRFSESCELKASTVECLLIPSFTTWSTPHLPHNRHSISISVESQPSFQSIYISRLTLSEPLTDCWWSVDRVSIGMPISVDRDAGRGFWLRVLIDTGLRMPLVHMIRFNKQE